MSQEKKFKIVLIAGEPSGDFLGSQLMKALGKIDESIEFAGVGGQLMEAEGLRSFFSISELSIMSVFDAPRKTFKVWKRLKETAQMIADINPTVIVTIDFPGFNFRLGKLLKRQLKETPLIHYVAPTVWAWRPGRAKKVSKFLDHLLTLFSFEPPYFKKYKLPTTFVGHPIVEMGFEKGNAQKFRRTHDISPQDTLLTILPGSRMVELKHHLKIFQQAVDLLRAQIPHLKVVIPTLPSFKNYLEKTWKSSVPTFIIVYGEEKKDAYAASQVAIAASGTIALELAQAQLPMVIAYKVSYLSGWMIKILVRIKHCCMVNILLRRSVIPELLQENCTARNLAMETFKIIKNPQKRQQQQEAFRRINELLAPKEGMPSEKAAAVIERYLRREKGQ